MHVRFEFTQDDLIDVSQRFLARSKMVRSWRWKGMLYTALLAWLLTFMFFLGSPAKGLVIGLIAAVVSALIYPSLHRSGVEKRLRKLHQEKLGEAGPFICEVELTPIGVWVRQMNIQTTHEWEGVEEIKETEDSVDILTRDGGGVVVRKRAFNSPDEQKQFIELAESYLELCRVGSSEGTPQLTTHSTRPE
jgi:hypothetical protein